MQKSITRSQQKLFSPEAFSKIRGLSSAPNILMAI
jgi:hypothetical protein